MKMGFRRQSMAYAGAVVLFFPLAGEAALADAPVETAIKDLVASIDSSSDWSAAYRNLAYDAVSDTAVVSGLSIATKNGNAKIDFESIQVAGYAAAADGGFTAKSIKADGGAVDAGPIKLAIGEVVLDDVGIPAIAGRSFDATKPFTSMMAMYPNIRKVSLGHGRIGSLSLIEVLQGVTSRVTYDNFEMSGLHDGKTDSITAGPIKLETPSPDGLVAISIASVEGSGIDMGAMIHVYNPAEYGSDGAGDLVWQPVLGHAAYKGIDMQLPGAKFAMDEFSADDFRMRQPKHSFAPFLDLAMTHPNLNDQDMDPSAREAVIDMFSAFYLGRFGVSGIKLEASGTTQFALDDFHVKDVSIEGLGEFAFDGVAASVEGQGAVTIGHFAFGGMKFPDAELLRTAIKSAGASGDVPPLPFPPTRLIPTLGFIEAGGIDVQTVDVPHVALDKLRVDLSDYVGYLPTKVSSAITGLEAPVDSMDRQSRETFKRLGYDRLNLDYRLKYAWEEGKQQLDIDDFHVRAAGIGGMTASAAIAGVTRAMIEHPDNAEGTQNLAMVSAKLSFSDESIVGKGLALLAEKFKAPPDKFRQQFADALPGLLLFSGMTNPQLMTTLRQSGFLQKLTPALKTFVAEPSGTITFTLAPAEPVGVAAIAEALQNAPETLVGLVNLSVSAEPAAAPDKAGGSNESTGTGLRQTIAPKQ